MAELKACEYFLIRVAPDPIREEFVNIGVALHEAGTGFAGLRVTNDFHRLHCFAPAFDAAGLEGLEADLRTRFERAPATAGDRDQLLALARETFSHSLTFSASHGLLTADPPRSLDELYRRYVAAPAAAVRAAAERRLGPRRLVLRHLTRLFRREQLLTRMRPHLRLGELLGDADPYRFDYYCAPSGTHLCIQAVALGEDDAGVRGLGFTAQRLKRQNHGGRLFRFTAIHGEDGHLGAEPRALIPLHRQLLEEAGVRLVPLAQGAQWSAELRAQLGSHDR